MTKRKHSGRKILNDFLDSISNEDLVFLYEWFDSDEYGYIDLCRDKFDKRKITVDGQTQIR